MKCTRCGTELPASRLAACPVCLLAGDDAEGAPRVLGQLELEEEIGRGGMGSVWRARHRGLDRTVAVKLLPEQLAKEPEFRARFEREARALALLDHPNIVRVHDFGHEGDESYLVLELVEGGTLAERIPLDPPRALEVASELLAALAYAHKRGVVHRDVKPQNILLDRDGRVKVTDFGIARIVQGAGTDWKVTASNVAVGTPGYLAPEALRGAAPDPRRDIYAVGVVLYEIATGKLPIGAFEPPPAPLEAIVKRALAADPEKRYATAEAMRADVEAARAALVVRPVVDDVRGDELQPDELAWMRIVALVHAISAAVMLWAILQCLTIRDDVAVPPLVIGHAVKVGDKWRSYARFETGWILAAAATLVPSLGAYGILRWHWRVAGLERDQPGRRVPASSFVFGCGLLSIALYVAHRTLDAHGQVWAATYVPIVGGSVLFAMLYFTSFTILEAWRTRRALAREWRAWVGFAIGVIPPLVHYALYATDGKPS